MFRIEVKTTENFDIVSSIKKYVDYNYGKEIWNQLAVFFNEMQTLRNNLVSLQGEKAKTQFELIEPFTKYV